MSHKKRVRVLICGLFACWMVGCRPITTDETAGTDASPQPTPLITVESSLPSLTGQPYPPPMPVEPSPNLAYPYPQATSNATVEAIISAKSTSAAEMGLTLTAAPTITPLPTFPVAAAPCQSSDLRSELFTGGATGSIVLVISVVNVSESICALQGPPDVQLLDQDKAPLDVTYFPWTEWASSAQNGPDDQIGIGPQETIVVRMMWRDWYKFAGQAIVVRLNLFSGTGFLENETKVFACEGCTYPDFNSWVMVSPFGRSP